ncbi:hypothetical protein O2W15_11325 [Modestobacter sp. VKM Ac-2979]|uniref:hypothetical protein n=1 Tax=unclassified Modestobacter TaxID=2643866 RepID=UPI0022ABA533|nr:MULTISPECIES: hypothetical protein [unclassified Modestobacter]MCZ2812024.1 hypothetical protein [Modestobacter sp. VKM Ac-2979]MCZ2843748.1 hypothetical protein [Modestobacter sp. VKM Ac-2980]
MDGCRALHVDGQDFTVTHRRGEPGVYDFDWLSGPHTPAYGFTTARSDGAAMSEAEMRAAIVGFLSQIYPETGYID